MDPVPDSGSPRRCSGIKRKSPSRENTDSKEGSLFNGSGDGILTVKNDSVSCQAEEPKKGDDNKDRKHAEVGGNHDYKGGRVCNVSAISASAILAVSDHRPSAANAPQAENKSVNHGSDNGSGRNVAAVGKKRGARDISEYKIICPVGEGTYGIVWKAIPPSKTGKTNEIVALKMIKTTELNTGGGSAPRSGQNTASSKGSAASTYDNFSEAGFPVTSVREIKILTKLRHKNIVWLKDVITDMDGKINGSRPGAAYMVFEYLEADLEGILKSSKVVLSALHVKTFMKQLVEGVAWMHKNKVMHRDLKGANLLIGSDGSLKIADFGLARTYLHQDQHTRTVISLWYRPPEVLLRALQYGFAVDMWSVGCIFAELMLRAPLMPGKDEQDQLERIFYMCGTPTEKIWPDVNKLPDWPHWAERVRRNPKPRSLRKKFEQCSTADSTAMDLLDRLLTLDPEKRIKAEGKDGAFTHEYFYSQPVAVEPNQLPRLDLQDCHEYEVKQFNERKRQEKERKHGLMGKRGHLPVGMNVRGGGRGMTNRGGGAWSVGRGIHHHPQSNLSTQSKESKGW